MNGVEHERVREFALANYTNVGSRPKSDREVGPLMKLQSRGFAVRRPNSDAALSGGGRIRQGVTRKATSSLAWPAALFTVSCTR
jgi:hypothetical protein